jgi:hypothetical protein
MLSLLSDPLLAIEILHEYVMICGCHFGYISHARLKVILLIRDQVHSRHFCLV